MDGLSAEEKELILQSRRTKLLAQKLEDANIQMVKAKEDQEQRDEQARTTANWLAEGGYNSAHLGSSRKALSESVEQVPPFYPHTYLQEEEKEEKEGGVSMYVCVRPILTLPRAVDMQPKFAGGRDE